MKLQKTPIALAAIALFSTPLAAQAAPSVSFRAPASGATISQPISNSSACEVGGSNIRRVVFSIRNTWGGSWTTLNTDTGSPWRCNLDPTDFPAGNYALRAVAYDRTSGGASDTATRSVRLAGGPNPTPSVSVTRPASGATVSGTSVACAANASDANGIRRVEFFLDNATTPFRTDTSSSYTCSFDSTRLSNGTHTLRAVATDNLNATRSAQVSFTVQNTVANTPPSVSLTAPTAATVSGNATYAANASDASPGSVARVDFFLINGTTQTLLTSKTAAPYQDTLDTTAHANGSYALMAQATDNQGAVATSQRSLTISNPVYNPDPPPAPAIDAADILTSASADVPFASQSGYTAQVINTYTSASQIAESGIHGSTLPNGETLRLGKTVDPMDSLKNALVFQVRNSDPTTSRGKRAELSVTPNIEMNRVYWIAFSAFVYDWGTLSTSDDALFGAQMHTGNNSLGVGGPSFGLYTTQTGRTFRVQARYSEAATPSEGNSVSVRYAEYPIPFGRWADFVLKFKHNTSGNGFLQVWMDGSQIADHQGSLGYNTPGYRDYAKFGYYNWSDSGMSSTPRKVLLRAPTIVADPTGSKYTHDQLRALVSTGGGSIAAGTGSAGAGSGTASSGGVCSTLLCAATQ